MADVPVLIGTGPDAAVDLDASPALDANASLDAGSPTAEAGFGDTGPDDRGMMPDMDAAVSDSGSVCDQRAQVVLSATVTPSLLSARVGQEILWIGRAAMGPLNCTLLACPMNQDCCNACTGTVEIDGKVMIMSNPCFPTAGCMGDECAQVCRPALLGTMQSFRGILRGRSDPGPAFSLELHEVSP